MGFELKILVGREYKGALGQYLDIITIIDLCKPGMDSKIGYLATQESGEGQYYFYSWDGNTEVKEDRYDHDLTAYPMGKVIDALEEDAKRDSYWRFKLALGILKSIKEMAPEEVKVVLYGY